MIEKDREIVDSEYVYLRQSTAKASLDEVDWSKYEFARHQAFSYILESEEDEIKAMAAYTKFDY